MLVEINQRASLLWLWLRLLAQASVRGFGHSLGVEMTVRIRESILAGLVVGVEVWHLAIGAHVDCDIDPERWARRGWMSHSVEGKNVV